MKTFLLACALLIAGLALPPPARAGDPETCAYSERALADACRTNPDVRAFLLEPGNLMVDSIYDIPPVIRGWMPGEEEAVMRAIQDVGIGCGYTDPIVAAACRYDPQVKAALQHSPRGSEAIWFDLPSDVGGWAKSMTDPRITRPFTSPAADRLRQRWMFDNVSHGERMNLIGRAVKRATGVDVEFARAFMVAVDETNFIACGYGFYNDGDTLSSGLFIFDSRGGSALRAPQGMFNAKCRYADVVLR